MKLSHVQIADEIERMEHLAADHTADELQLWGWGKWARNEGGNLGYPRGLLPFLAKGWPERDLSRVIESIPDDMALQIDSAVAALPVQHKSVVVAIYRNWMPIRTLPLKMAMPRSHVESYHHQALGMLYEKLRSKTA